MENVSKALLISAGVLLSIMVVSLLVYTGKSFGKISRAEQEAKLTKDRQAFNAEYEVYDKSLMYGTDVLSCLNKAQSNNQKYVNNNYFGKDNLGSETRMEYLINVEVKLKSTITESVRVFKLNSAGRRIQTITGTEISTDKLFKNTSSVHFDIPNSVIWYYFENGKVKRQTGKYADTLWANPDLITNSNLKTQTFNTELVAGTYELFTEGKTDDGRIGKLSALLSTATLVEQTVYNDNYTSTDDWYCAIWRTAAYTFKTKKFKCTGVEYSKETGYISKISFEEIGNVPRNVSTTP